MRCAAQSAVRTSRTKLRERIAALGAVIVPRDAVDRDFSAQRHGVFLGAGSLEASTMDVRPFAYSLSEAQGVSEAQVSAVFCMESSSDLWVELVQ